MELLLRPLLYTCDPKTSVQYEMDGKLEYNIDKFIEERDMREILANSLSSYCIMDGGSWVKDKFLESLREKNPQLVIQILNTILKNQVFETEYDYYSDRYKNATIS